MMPTGRLDRQLPELLTELAKPQTPDYFVDLLALTAGTRQRSVWTFLERWLPMVDITRQPVLAPRVPLRAIGLGLLLVGLILAALTALAVGTRPNLPAPFGPARAGLVAYAKDGDIYTVHPGTGVAVAVVSGPETDVGPVWSLDGTRIAFERKAAGESGPGLLFVARGDGTDLKQVTLDPLEVIEGYSFSPDGREILISARPSPTGTPSILIAASDGSRIRELDVGRSASNPSWRPVDGAEILFTDDQLMTGDAIGFYAVASNGGSVRTIVRSEFSRYRGFPLWSPDGTRLVYSEWVDSPDLTVREHIIAADGTGDRILPIPAGAMWEAGMAWSNDGTRLLSIRGYSGSYDGSRAVARPVDGTGTGSEIDYDGTINAECCSAWQWAADDASILGPPTGPLGQALDQVLLDPVAGTSRTVPWSTTSPPAWQRLAR
jgi:hypothetical protein